MAQAFIRSDGIDFQNALRHPLGNDSGLGKLGSIVGESGFLMEASAMSMGAPPLIGGSVDGDRDRKCLLPKRLEIAIH